MWLHQQLQPKEREPLLRIMSEQLTGITRNDSSKDHQIAALSSRSRPAEAARGMAIASREMAG